MPDFIVGEIIPARVLAKVGEQSWQIQLRGRLLVARTGLSLNPGDVLVQVRALYPKPSLRILNFTADPAFNRAVLDNHLLLEEVHLYLLQEIAAKGVLLDGTTPALLPRLTALAEVYDTECLIPIGELAATLAGNPQLLPLWDSTLGQLSAAGSGFDPCFFPNLPLSVWQAWDERCATGVAGNDLQVLTSALNQAALGRWQLDLFMLPEQDLAHLIMVQSLPPQNTEYPMVRRQLHLPVYTPGSFILEGRFWQNRLGLVAHCRLERVEKLFMTQKAGVMKLAAEQGWHTVSCAISQQSSLSVARWCAAKPNGLAELQGRP